MKRLFVLLVISAFCVFGGLATVVPPGACPGDRESLLQCFDQLLDLNHDGNLTVTELDAGFANFTAILPSQTAFTDQYNSTFIMNACDIDQDGILSPADWSHADACLQWAPSVDYICRLCYIAGWVPSKKR